MNKLIIPLFITLLGLQSLLALKASYIEELDVLEGSEAHKLLVRTKDLKMSNSKSKTLKLKLDLSEIDNLTMDDKYSLELYYYDSYGDKVLVNNINQISVKKRKAFFPAKIANLHGSNYIFLDLRDNEDNLVSSYRAFIEQDDDSQEMNSAVTLSIADCDETKGFGECQLEYILKNLSFRTYKSQSGETLVSKDDSGKYSVYIPVKQKAHRAKKLRRRSKRVARSRDTSPYQEQDLSWFPKSR